MCTGIELALQKYSKADWKESFEKLRSLESVEAANLVSRMAVWGSPETCFETCDMMYRILYTNHSALVIRLICHNCHGFHSSTHLNASTQLQHTLLHYLHELNGI